MAWQLSYCDKQICRKCISNSLLLAGQLLMLTLIIKIKENYYITSFFQSFWISPKLDGRYNEFWTSWYFLMSLWSFCFSLEEKHFLQAQEEQAHRFQSLYHLHEGQHLFSSEGFITSFLSASGFKRTIIIEVTAAALQKGKMKRITRNHTGMAVRRQESISYAVSSKTDFCCVTTRDSTCMMFAVYVSQVS